eukprot:SAG11_NODE_1846_length_4172_cov_3.188313_4_plen_122_part_00
MNGAPRNSLLRQSVAGTHNHIEGRPVRIDDWRCGPDERGHEHEPGTVAREFVRDPSTRQPTTPLMIIMIISLIAAHQRPPPPPGRPLFVSMAPRIHNNYIKLLLGSLPIDLCIVTFQFYLT